MYTNIDTDSGLQAFKTLFSEYTDKIPAGFPQEFFLKVLKLIMTFNIFQLDDTFWWQITGTAMGTPAACMYATITYGVHELLRILTEFKDNLIFYKRYIDDIIGIWIPILGTDDEVRWSNFKTLLDGFGNLKWKVDDRTFKVTFLDLNLELKNGRIHTSTYQKPMNLYLYLPALSAHPAGCLKGLIVGNIIRFWQQNPKDNFQKLTKEFIMHLVRRGHALSSLKDIMLQAATIIENKKIKTIAHQPDNIDPNEDDNLPPFHTNRQKSADTDQTTDYLNRKLYLHWEYHPHGLQNSQIRKIYSTTLQNKDNFKGGMTIALSRPKNLRDTVTRTTMKEIEGQRVSDFLTKKLTTPSL
jgi:hypothetical protein